MLIGIVFHFKDLFTIDIHILEIVSCQYRIEFLSKMNISLSRLWIMLTLSILLQDACCIKYFSVLLMLLLRGCSTGDDR